MEISLHIGAHLTDENQLLSCLRRNSAALAKQGIAVPAPGRYRQQLQKLSAEMHGKVTDAQTQEALLDGVLEADDVSRVVFSIENLMAIHDWILADGQFYPRAGPRIAGIRHLFPTADFHVYLAIRNPASFLPALAHDKRAGGVDGALKGTDPASVRWSSVVARIKEAAPDVKITVWCDEDTALLWPEILRAVAGHTPETELVGWFRWYWDFIAPKSHEAMRRYFANNPITDDAHRRRVLSAMLEKFARPDVLEAEASLPGWTDDYIEILTEIYNQDLDLIASMPGVTLLE